MPDPKLIVPSSYAELRRAVEVAMVRGQQVVEQVKLRTYHETGRLLDLHLAHHAGEGGHGTAIMRRLAADLRLEERILYRCLQFARAYPKLSARTKLTWAYYRLLMQVPDKARRTALERETTARDWTSAQLEERIRGLMAASGPAVVPVPAPDQPPARLLTPKRGTPGVCKVIAVGDALVVDLGFATYLDLPSSTSLGAGDFVRIAEDGVGRAKDATKADLFTYRAEVLKVVDGDTLWVKIYLRPDQWVKEKLRLRDLDCPELSTPEGKAARRFTEWLVPAGTAVTVCTTKPDKYDRYLADVFVAKPGEMRAQQVYAPTGETYLNNALLAAGHAQVKRSWEFGDWGA